MMFKKSNPITEHIENYYREIYEFKQAQVWISSGIFFSISGGYQALNALLTSEAIPDTMMLTGFGMVSSLVMAAVRTKEGWPIAKLQARLCSSSITIETLEATRRKSAKLKKRMYLGTGFEWGPEHAYNMYRVNAMPSSRRNMKVPFWMRKFVPYNPELNEILGGEPFLISLDTEKPVSVHPDTWRAHTLILGLPGTGKTTLLKLIALNKLWQDSKVLLIVIDPKNTPEMREGLRAEMRRQGREDQFYFFSPARASESVILDCLANYNRPQEIATRICECIPSGGSSGEVFKSFIWERINQVVMACEYVGEKITLRGLRYYLREGMAKLVEQTLTKYFEQQAGPDWKVTHEARIKAKGNKEWLENLIAYYVDVMAKDNANDSVSGIIEQFRKPQSDVLSKTASLNSILEQLCSEPLGDLLSPRPEKMMENDPRVVNLRELSNTGGVLYMATDGLTDPVIAGTISKLSSAAVAAASAERYNFGTGDEPNVCFMVDEAHSALNESILNLLAVGRQSKYELFLSTQSMPDIIEKTSEATAERVKGLCANTIALRCEDTVTREFVSEKFREADLKKYQKMRSNSTNVADALSDFNAGAGVREDSQERALFPPYMVSALPNLQAMCSFSNGNKTLLRLPVEPR
ncbi:conjugative transfer system coupling protein TraD (plasmid) [Vibrio scophthalmi]|uniref:conjugative transfer system coupling protein TraD n=1 Tax=Vibrio scophthalmi TaxID=45658 RepID=UPI003EB8180E